MAETIQTGTMTIAVVGASVGTAISSDVTFLTEAGSIETLAMTRTILRAFSQATVHTLPSSFTFTSRLLTYSMTTALIGTR
jgi:hypothetical protein